VTSSIKSLVREYDEKWSALDVAGVAGLWERDNPQPVYIGDEYPTPLIGVGELDRHWARIGGRLKRAPVSSQRWSADELAGGLVRCVLLSRWSFTGIESDITHTGASWVTWLLTARGDKYRIFHQVESQVYLEECFQTRAATTSPEDERV
jgi:hypothetical protein